MSLSPIDYDTLVHKVSIIIERTPIELRRKKLMCDDTTFIMSFPCGFLKTLEIWYTVVNPKAKTPAYVLTNMFLTTWCHNYELNLERFDRVFIMGRVMRYRKELEFLRARKERLKLEDLPLKATRKLVKLIHRIR